MEGVSAQVFRRSNPNSETGTDMQRFFAFSDGVFAIAITLLALDLKVPVLPADQISRLPQEILNQIPSFMSYAISFIVVGTYWNAHHRMFRFIVKYDNALLWLNILFLMTLCFLPFPTVLTNRYINQVFPTVFYAGSVAVIGLTMNLLWAYAAWKHRLLAPHLPKEMVRQVTWRMLTPPVFFIASIPFALLNPRLSQFIWILAMFIRPSVRHKQGQEPTAA